MDRVDLEEMNQCHHSTSTIEIDGEDQLVLHKVNGSLEIVISVNSDIYSNGSGLDSHENFESDANNEQNQEKHISYIVKALEVSLQLFLYSFSLLRICLVTLC